MSEETKNKLQIPEIYKEILTSNSSICPVCKGEGIITNPNYNLEKDNKARYLQCPHIEILKIKEYLSPLPTHFKANSKSPPLPFKSLYLQFSPNNIISMKKALIQYFPQLYLYLPFRELSDIQFGNHPLHKSISQLLYSSEKLHILNIVHFPYAKVTSDSSFFSIILSDYISLFTNKNKVLWILSSLPYNILKTNYHTIHNIINENHISSFPSTELQEVE